MIEGRFRSGRNDLDESLRRCHQPSFGRVWTLGSSRPETEKSPNGRSGVPERPFGNGPDALIPVSASGDADS